MPTLESLSDPWKTRCKKILRAKLKSQACQRFRAQVLEAQPTRDRMSPCEHDLCYDDPDFRLPVFKEPTSESLSAASHWLENLDVGTVPLKYSSYEWAKTTLESEDDSSVKVLAQVLVQVMRPLFRACLQMCFEMHQDRLNDDMPWDVVEFGEGIVFGGKVYFKDELLMVVPWSRPPFAMTASDLQKLPWDDTLSFLPFRPSQATGIIKRSGGCVRYIEGEPERLYKHLQNLLLRQKGC